MEESEVAYIVALIKKPGRFETVDQAFDKKLGFTFDSAEGTEPVLCRFSWGEERVVRENLLFLLYIKGRPVNLNQTAKRLSKELLQNLLFLLGTRLVRAPKEEQR